MAFKAATLDPILDIDRNRFNDRIKVMIATPSMGIVRDWCIDNHGDLMFHLGRLEAQSNFKFFRYMTNRLSVHMAREHMAKNAFDAGMDYIFWFDDDMLLPPDTFEILYKHDVGMVSPLTFMRVPPYNPVMWRIEKLNDGEIRFYHIDKWESNKFLQVDAMGFGCVLMKVPVLNRIPPPWFFTTLPLGEDLSFCYKAKINGVKSYVDTSFEIKHLSSGIPVGIEQYHGFRETGKLYIQMGVPEFSVGDNGKVQSVRQ